MLKLTVSCTCFVQSLILHCIHSFAVNDICGVMNAKMTIAEKQYLAKILFTREHLDQKTVAQKVHVSERTMSIWVNDFNWKSLKNRLLIGKEEVLSNLYEQISELNQSIRDKKEGARFGNSKEADVLIKYTASIRNLETELAIADLVESGIRFIKHLQKVATIEQVLEISELWHSFLQVSIKK